MRSLETLDNMVLCVGCADGYKTGWPRLERDDREDESEWLRRRLRREDDGLNVPYALIGGMIGSRREDDSIGAFDGKGSEVCGLGRLRAWLVLVAACDFLESDSRGG